MTARDVKIIVTILMIMRLWYVINIIVIALKTVVFPELFPLISDCFMAWVFWEMRKYAIRMQEAHPNEF